MKRTAALGICLISLSALAQPPRPPGPPGSSIEYQVVGFTAVTDGSIEALAADGRTVVGYAAMHRLCALIDPSWRAATTVEFLRSRNMPQGPRDEVWLIPTDPKLLHLPGDPTGEWMAYDATLTNPYQTNSPAGALRGLSCYHHTNHESSSFTSGIVGSTTDQGIERSSCGAEHPVACAAPVAVPVSD